MKLSRRSLARLPGRAASGLMILISAVWAYWGVAEMYHEGWWGAWYNRLPYLVPTVVTLGPMLLAFRWPIVGGITIAAIGVFALFFFDNDVAFMGLAIALLGAAFLVDGFVKQKLVQRRRLCRSTGGGDTGATGWRWACRRSLL